MPSHLLPAENIFASFAPLRLCAFAKVTLGFRRSARAFDGLNANGVGKQEKQADFVSRPGYHHACDIEQFMHRSPAL
jgi:hypothetical protein